MSEHETLTLREKAVNKFWEIMSPVLMFSRDILIKLKILKHNFRQPFILGKLAPQKSMEELVRHLENHGFRNHFFAWDDPGQKYSLRLRDNFKYQYHLRIFQDNEIRGHYELTPEAHPIRHALEHDFEERREKFMEYLQGWIIHQ